MIIKIIKSVFSSPAKIEKNDSPLPLKNLKLFKDYLFK